MDRVPPASHRGSGGNGVTARSARCVTASVEDNRRTGYVDRVGPAHGLLHSWPGAAVLRHSQRGLAVAEVLPQCATTSIEVADSIVVAKVHPAARPTID